MPAASPVRKQFTRDQDSLLIGYIAEYNPGSPGRCGNKLYQRLVENLDGQWNWSSHRSWSSWRDRYVKNQSQFDPRIKTYQQKNGLPTENAGHINGTPKGGNLKRGQQNPRIKFTINDDTCLIEYIANQNPGAPGRTGNSLYQRLVDNVDNEWSWGSRHPWSAWRERYRKRQSEFNQRIMQYQEDAESGVTAAQNNGTRGEGLSQDPRRQILSHVEVRKAIKTVYGGKRSQDNRPDVCSHNHTRDSHIDPLQRVNHKKSTTRICVQAEAIGMESSRDRTEVRAAPSTRSPARHSLQTINAAASPSSLPVSATSSSREVSPTPAPASRMPSADLNQGPSPPRSRSASQRMQAPVEQLPRQPVDRSPSSQRLISPLDWGSPKSTALSVEPVEDSNWFQIFAQQSQKSQFPPSLFLPESRLQSVKPNDRHTSPEHEVHNSPLYTRRPPRRFRLFQSRPVSMDEGQLGKGVSAGVQHAATHGFDAEVVKQVFEASRNHEMGERILFRMRQAADAVRQAALDEIAYM